MFTGERSTEGWEEVGRGQVKGRQGRERDDLGVYIILPWACSSHGRCKVGWA
jgi:hypothetical protein